jgi:hypothetical protein
VKPVKVDGTRHSAVTVCNGCGAREVGTTRGVVLRAAADHYLVAHPDQVEAAEQLRRRAAELVEPTRRKR